MSLFQWIVSAIIVVVVFRTGFKMLRALATPLREPNDGELRKVNLRYKCSNCGTELRITSSTEDEPAPPRHCMEDMEVVPSKFDQD